MRLLVKIALLVSVIPMLYGCAYHGTYHSQPSNQAVYMESTPLPAADAATNQSTPNAPTPAGNLTTLPTTAGVIPVGTSAEMKAQLPTKKQPLPSGMMSPKITAPADGGVSSLPDVN